MTKHTSDYLDLLAGCLAFEFWPEPLRPLNTTAHRGIGYKCAKFADRLLRRFGLSLALLPKDHPDGTYWPALAHTMVGKARLGNIRSLCRNVDFRNVPGAFVECGVWRGGASIYARACLDDSREVICCDSFAGMPFDPAEPEFAEYDFLKVSLQDVRRNFARFGQLHNVLFVEGLFSETLRTIKEPIAILRCDGDMHSSTLQILADLYPWVSRGGYVIIDDYWLEPCKRAVDDYRRINNVTSPIINIDSSSVYWRKP